MSKRKFFKYFSVRELVQTIVPSDLYVCCTYGYMDNLLLLLSILDEFREQLNSPIYVTSSFRSKEHNANVGGSPTSQHLTGEAIDFVVSGVMFDVVMSSFILFISKYHKNDVGQVIFYRDKCFVHMALPGYKFKSFSYYEKRKNQNNH